MIIALLTKVNQVGKNVTRIVLLIMIIIVIGLPSFSQNPSRAGQQEVKSQKSVDSGTVNSALDRGVAAARAVLYPGYTRTKGTIPLPFEYGYGNTEHFEAAGSNISDFKLTQIPATNTVILSFKKEVDGKKIAYEEPIKPWKSSRNILRRCSYGPEFTMDHLFMHSILISTGSRASVETEALMPAFPEGFYEHLMAAEQVTASISNE